MKRLLLGVLLSAGMSGCALEDSTTGVETREVITLQLEDAEISADGLDLVRITADLGEKSDVNKEITFKTDWGFLAGVPRTSGTESKTFKVVASGRTATVYLRADSTFAERAGVTATVGGFVTDTMIVVRHSVPVKVQAYVNKGSIKADLIESAEVKVYLTAARGWVTDRTRVDFIVRSPASGPPLAIMTPYAYSYGGVATATIRSLDALTGNVTIEAHVSGGAPPGTTTLQLR
jgi:hypothetical protein